MLLHTLHHHGPSDRQPLLGKTGQASKPFDRLPAKRPVSSKQQAARTIAQHAQHAQPTHQTPPVPPAAPATKSLVQWAPPPMAPGDMPADIRYTLEHSPGFTTQQKTMAYGLWCLVVVVRTIAAGVGGGAAEASPFLSLAHSAMGIYDAACGVNDQGIAKDKYEKAQQVHQQALAHWRQLAAQVDAQPLDEASEQMLAASRHLVVLLAQILDGYESAYFSIAKAKRLKAQRDLSLAGEDKWLERQRVPDTPANAARRAQLGQELKDTLSQLQALPQTAGTKHRDLERLQHRLRARARQIKRLEAQPHPLRPAVAADLHALRQDQARQLDEFKRLKPFFNKSQGPVAFLNPSDIGTKALVALRDEGLNKITQPAVLLGVVANFTLQNLPVSELVLHGAGIGFSMLNVLLTPATFAYAHYDMEFAKRGHTAAQKQDRQMYRDLERMVSLKGALSGHSTEATVGRYLAENRLRTLLQGHKQFKRDKLFLFWRSFRSQMTFFTIAPATAVVGSAALGFYIAGNVATAGALGIATAAVAGLSLAILLAAVALRCRLAKLAKDEDKLKLRTVRHLQAVLGPDGVHGLYTLSAEDFDRRMQPVIASAPKGLRRELTRERLLKDNKFFAVEWCSQELLRGAQKAAREQGPVADSWARQMLLQLGLPEADANHLQTCRPLCTDDAHYLDICRKTIAAQLFNGSLRPDERLPHRQSPVGLQASAQVLLDQLKAQKHAALSRRVDKAKSADALLPRSAPHGKELLEEQLAQLRADLLIGHVDQQGLVELRKTVNDKDPMAWLLDALIDPARQGQAPNPLKAPAQAPVVPAPLLSYEMLDRAIKYVGRQNESEVIRYFKGNALTPNPMGTAREFLARQSPERIDQVLAALADWKRGELQKTDGQPTVPPGYPSMDAWLLAAMNGIRAQCLQVANGIQIQDDKGQQHGKKLQRRLDDWSNAAQLCAQHLQARIAVPVPLPAHAPQAAAAA